MKKILASLFLLVISSVNTVTALENNRNTKTTIPGILKILIEKGSSVNIKNTNGETPLIIAINNGNTSIIDYLISQGAILDCANYSGQNPLLKLTDLMPNDKYLKNILPYGLKISEIHYGSQNLSVDGSPLQVLISNKKYNLIKYLINNDNLNIADILELEYLLKLYPNNELEKLITYKKQIILKQETKLIRAIASNNIDEIRNIINNKNITAQELNELSYFSARTSNFKYFLILFEKFKNNKELNPILNNYLEFLLEYQTIIFDNTPYSIRQDLSVLISNLLNNNEYLSRKTSLAVIAWAAWLNIEISPASLNNNILLDQNLLRQKPLIFWAMKGNNKKIFNLIFYKINKNPNYSFTTRKNQTLLSLACLAKNSEIVTQLINGGADVNKPDDNGITPLQIAITNNNTGIVSILLNKGATTNITINYYNKNYSLIPYAKKISTPEIVMLLEQKIN